MLPPTSSTSVGYGVLGCGVPRSFNGEHYVSYFLERLAELGARYVMRASVETGSMERKCQSCCVSCGFYWGTILIIYQ